jgi:hypothetical protein
VEGKFYPSKFNIATMGLGVEINYTIIPGGTLTDRAIALDYAINFLNTTNVQFSATRIYQLLPEDFNPLYPRGEIPYLAGQQFNWNEFNFQFNSNARKVINYSIQASGGEFYTGTRQSYGGTLNYRYQPYGSLAVTVDYNNLQLGAPYGKAEFLLVRPRLDFTLSTKLFLTGVVQYNTRFDSYSMNARLQWRFKPASDLFLVYNHVENKVPQDLRSNTQALVIKFTYWLNL